MADKNLQMRRKRADGGFDDYFPITKATNVKMSGGSTVEDYAVRFQRGSLSSFSKSMAPLEEYIVTIPVMPEAQSGRIHLSGSNYIGMEITFNRSSLEGYSISVAGTNTCASSKLNSGYVSYYGYAYGGSSTVKILECYIDSNNSIVIKFVNTHMSSTTAISVASISWEVKSQ